MHIGDFFEIVFIAATVIVGAYALLLFMLWCLTPSAKSYAAAMRDQIEWECPDD